MIEPNQMLDRARRDAGLSHEDLWLRYFALGGMRTEFELEGILYGALAATSRDHDLIAVALNERFSELGADHPISTPTTARLPSRMTQPRSGPSRNVRLRR